MSVFDGLAGVLAGTFGAPVTITRISQAPVTVLAVFRETSVMQSMADGRELPVIVPTLQVSRALIAAIARGDLIAPSVTPGRTFTVLAPHVSGSPAVDGFIIAELEEVLP